MACRKYNDRRQRYHHDRRNGEHQVRVLAELGVDLAAAEGKLAFLRRREAVTPIWISASTAVPATATVDIHVWLAETSAR